MCHICDSEECAMCPLLKEVMRTEMTYIDLWEQFRAEEAAVNEQLRLQRCLEVRIINLRELFPEAFTYSRQNSVQNKAEEEQPQKSDEQTTGVILDSGEDTDTTAVADGDSEDEVERALTAHGVDDDEA
ncbi:hypothetical protein BD626DRAFT_575665 [Schizophyllum amplum]|uniref:Uncharacterized protein n=1 Tax=Schizophyllum amplum TaxID=97359 RepID=A0A550BVC3_9AGAR|nr:hypothetical protein BD626DRAFT_575665 [Auriculariopsis ampla]